VMPVRSDRKKIERFGVSVVVMAAILHEPRRGA